MSEINETLERMLAKLDRLDERFGDLRVDMAALRGDIANVRGLVDGVHVRAEKIELENAAIVLRLRALEDHNAEERGAQSRRTAVSLGAAAGGGGAVAALAEVLRTFIAMP
jgi:predicted  nucleic acid-binding Zn-ribbon protein